MVVLSTAAGFSSALGAFIMGSILAETLESEHIDHLVHPIKDLFGAIFFVSVGMMVSPQIIAHHALSIIVITLLVYTTHILFAGAGVLLSGGGLRNAVYTGFSLAQLGEFGFIIASVGVSLGVMRDFTYPVIIAVSVITTFTTPYMIRFAPKAYELLQRKLPRKFLDRVDVLNDDGKMSYAESGEWNNLLRNYFLRVLLYSVVLIAISIGSSLYLEPLLGKIAGGLPEIWLKVIAVVLTIAIMAPFLYGLAINTHGINGPALKLMSEKKSNTLPIMGLVLLRIFIAMGFILAVISSHFQLEGWALVMILLAGVAFFYIGRRYMNKYSALEKRFLENFNEKENERRRRTPITTGIRDKMSGYDLHIETVDVAPESVYAGQKIKQIPFRDESGVNIVKIQRGTINITIPNGNEYIYPHDHLVAVGTSSQIERFRRMMQASVSVPAGENIEFKVVSMTLDGDSYLTGKTLKDTNMREYKYMVLSVLRGEEFIANPRADFRFEAGDVVWVAGDPESCEWIK